MEFELTPYEIDINEMYRESDAKFNDCIILEFISIALSTEKANLISRNDKEKGESQFWIAKSQCDIQEEDNLIAMPIWVFKSLKEKVGRKRYNHLEWEAENANYDYDSYNNYNDNVYGSFEEEETGYWNTY